MFEITVEIERSIDISVEVYNPPEAGCQPVAISNSDDSYTATVAAGVSHELPDITVTRPDGSQTQHPSVIDIIVAWVLIYLVNSKDMVIDVIDTYPTGNRILIPDMNFTMPSGQVIIQEYESDIDIPFEAITLTSNDVQVALINDYPAGGILNLGTVTHTDSDGSSVVMAWGQPFAATPFSNANVFHTLADGSIDPTPVAILGSGDSYVIPTSLVIGVGGGTLAKKPFDQNIRFTGNDPTSILVVGDELHIAVPSAPPSGVIPQRPSFNGQVDSYRTGDAGWHFINGTFTYADVGDVVQALDHASAEPFYTLVHNNMFGNKYRFTDTVGAPANDGKSDFDVANFVSSRPTAVPYYVIDHRTGWAYVIIKVGYGELWEPAIDTSHGFVNVFDDYLMLTKGLLNSVISTEDAFNGVKNIFEQSNIIAPGTDSQMWLSETYHADPTQAYRYINSNEIRRYSKTIGSFFGTYVCRKHF